MTNIKNIYENFPDQLPEELIEIISGNGKVRIERIVSSGHSSADDFWYNQDSHEFVILLRGKAALRFRDNDKTIILNAGDYLEIPAHVKHRVAWTSPEEKTIWLAVHY